MLHDQGHHRIDGLLIIDHIILRRMLVLRARRPCSHIQRALDLRHRHRLRFKITVRTFREQEVLHVRGKRVREHRHFFAFDRRLPVVSNRIFGTGNRAVHTFDAPFVAIDYRSAVSHFYRPAHALVCAAQASDTFVFVNLDHFRIPPLLFSVF